jgi:hypothetical protein
MNRRKRELTLVVVVWGHGYSFEWERGVRVGDIV